MSALSAISWTNGGVERTEVFAIGVNNVVYVNIESSGWMSLGADAKQISAGLDAVGKPEVYAIAADNAVYVSDDGNGWDDLGGYVTALCAAADSTLYARGEDLNSVFVSSGGSGLGYVGDISFANPVAATGYSPAPAGASLFLASNSGEFSYLDVDQGYVGDCWLLASLAEVSARDPTTSKTTSKMTPIFRKHESKRDTRE